MGTLGIVLLVIVGIVVVVIVCSVIFWGIPENKRQKEASHNHWEILNKNGFKVSKYVTNDDYPHVFSIFIDLKNKKWSYYDYSKKISKIYKFEDLLDYEIVEDGQSIVQGKTASTIIGGVLGGGLGALAGASGSRRIDNVCNKLEIKLNVNNVTMPSIQLVLLDKETAKGSAKYKSCYDKAIEFEAILKIIMANANEKSVPAQSNNDKKENTKSTKAELQELKEMFDDGLITQEEFEQKRKQILGL
ncbi:MAG: SHOCT domain-containing protein [Clostridiales bacterium]|nr:SHOCT domain-containing protein [Clostridiales bacterium]